jgi:hypothetical protein
MENLLRSRMRWWFKTTLVVTLIWAMPKQVANTLHLHIPHFMTEVPANWFCIIGYTVWLGFSILAFTCELEFSENSWGWSLFYPWTSDKAFYSSKRKSWTEVNVRGQYFGPIKNLSLVPSSTPFSIIWNTTHTNYGLLAELIKSRCEKERMDKGAKRVLGIQN